MYAHLSDEEKIKFFNIDLPSAEPIQQHSQVDKKRVYCIRAPIINNVVKKHSIPDDTEHEHRSTITNVLKRVGGDKYSLNIYNISRSNIIFKFVGDELFFSQALQSARAVRDVGGSANFSGVPETDVRQSAESMIDINLHLLQNLVCDSGCWAFSIAFDASTSREDVYLDVRICAVFRDVCCFPRWSVKYEFSCDFPARFAHIIVNFRSRKSSFGSGAWNLLDRYARFCRTR